MNFLAHTLPLFPGPTIILSNFIIHIEDLSNSRLLIFFTSVPPVTCTLNFLRTCISIVTPGTLSSSEIAALSKSLISTAQLIITFSLSSLRITTSKSPHCHHIRTSTLTGVFIFPSKIASSSPSFLIQLSVIILLVP